MLTRLVVALRSSDAGGSNRIRLCAPFARLSAIARGESATKRHDA